MNKKVLIPIIIGVFVIGIAFASVYIVNSLTLTSGVAEPFTVQYAVLGDGHGGYEGLSCADEGTVWFTSTSASIPTGDFYPMESRYVCIKITNKAEAVIPYTINSYVTNDNLAGDCATAFGLPTTLTGDASALSDTTTGKEIKIAAGATPVTGCNVVIDVARG